MLKNSTHSEDLHAKYQICANAQLAYVIIAMGSNVSARSIFFVVKLKIQVVKFNFLTKMTFKPVTQKIRNFIAILNLSI